MKTKEAKAKALKKSLKKKTASVELINPATLIAMREEFDNIFTKEAEQVQHKVSKARLLEIIKNGISH